MNSKVKSFIGIAAIVVLFILASCIIQKNLEFFNNLIGTNFSGMLMYVVIITIAIVVAPVSALPLLPVVSNLWGWVVAGTLSAIGWSIGALIAFIIARKYGVKIARKLIPIEKVHELEKRIHRKHLFWSIVLLRMVFPVDIISYTLGLFSKIKTKKYILATVMGIVPYSFIMAYLGRMPFQYQIIISVIVIILLLIGFIIQRRNDKIRIKKAKKAKNLRKEKKERSKKFLKLVSPKQY